MKAKDIITPGDYEVRPYKGGERKVHIVRVEKRTVRVHPDGSFEGYDSLQWRAIAEYEHLGQTRELEYPLAQVIRPWAEAESDHQATQAGRAAAERTRARLEAILRELGITTRVSSDFGLDLTQEQAVDLTNLLRVAGEGRA